MKILGEKSLASKVIIGLNILFTAISIIDAVVLSIIAKIVTHIVMGEEIQNNISDLVFFIMLISTGIIALFIIYQFIKIFKNLKKEVLYELVKAFMGPFKAGFYQTFAALFGASLKKQYDPMGDDALTERVILMVESGQL